MSGGRRNEAKGGQSTVGGGSNNTANGAWSTVGGGISNVTNRSTSTIGGGQLNTTIGSSCTIGGGSQNTAGSDLSTIGGGHFNKAQGQYSVVAGGGGAYEADSNSAIGKTSTISGGRGNVAGGDLSTVGGGQSNTASDSNSTVGGGLNNDATGNRSFVGGGELNTASGYHSAVVGGVSNRASNEMAFVGGGQSNHASGVGVAICGGNGNNGSNFYSSIGGGLSNTAEGQFSVVPGGRDNEATADYAFAAGNRAHAIHAGSFVWRDMTNANFTSTGSGQFLIRASGGTGIGSSAPGTSTVLEVADGYRSGYVEMIRLQSTTDPDPSDDIVTIEAPTGTQTNFQFIECENGATAQFRVWGNGDVTAAGTITGGGADLAEMVSVSTGALSVESGDVMVIDPANPRALTQSVAAHSTLVAGIYSTTPGFLASEHDWDQVALEKGLIAGVGDDEEAESLPVMEVAAAIGEIPLAVVGIVPCKVTAENGAIHPGDLLVTSSTAGHAMRGGKPSIGTVIGKALGTLESGSGTIDVLVTLQ